MYKSFENLPEEKKARILDASMVEFGNNGYDKASTNNIVKKAGISKGLLFHYFGNKKNLFLYLVDRTMDYYIKKFYSTGQDLPSDLFEKIVARGTIKLKMAYEDPLKYKLIFNAYIDTPKDVQRELAERYARLANEHYPLFFKDIDTSRFRQDIDKNKAMELVILLMEGITNKYIAEYKHRPPEDALNEMDRIIEEYLVYADMIKWGIYDRKDI